MTLTNRALITDRRTAGGIDDRPQAQFSTDEDSATQSVLAAITGMVPVVDGTETVIYECRHCGTTVDGLTATCPCCGRTDVARYVVD